MCTADQWRCVVNCARAKAGVTQEGSEIVALLKTLIDRRTSDGHFIDYLDVDFEPETDIVRRLFYASGLMIEQFKVHGQFVIMDATHKTNRFNMPLVLLVGVDDTEATTIFGMGLLQAEDNASWRWIMEAFRRAVGTKQSTHILALPQPQVKMWSGCREHMSNLSSSVGQLLVRFSSKCCESVMKKKVKMS
jgi:hypothetical protein